MTEPRHLLHVFSTFAPAGPELRAVELMRGLGPGWRHTIVAMDDVHDAAARLDPSVRCELRPGPGRVGMGATVRWTRALLRELAPDLLCTYNWGAFDVVLGARLARFGAHVHHEDGFNLDEARRQLPRRLWMRRALLRGVRTVVVPSANLERIARGTWWLGGDRVRLVVNGVDEARFLPLAGEAGARERAEVRLGLGIPDEALVVGCVAGHRPVKRLERLIEAASRTALPAGSPPLFVLLVGDGPERPNLQAAAARWTPPGGRVVFAGARADLPPLLRAMDVFSLSSDSEQQPVSLLEAMACGLPVAATAVGDVAPTLPEAAAPQLVDAAGPDPAGALAEALTRLLLDPGLRAHLGALGRARVLERYSLASMLEAYRAIYAGAAEPAGQA